MSSQSTRLGIQLNDVTQTLPARMPSPYFQFDNLVYTSIVHFEHGVVQRLTHSQLGSLCAEAFAEMEAEHTKLQFQPRLVPTVMVALAHDDVLFFASSMRNKKNNPLFDESTSQTKTMLQDFQRGLGLEGDHVGEDGDGNKEYHHKNKWSCAEIWALSMAIHKTKTIPRKIQQPPVFASWYKDQGLVDPCSQRGTQSRQFGCSNLLESLGAERVETGTELEAVGESVMAVSNIDLAEVWG